MKLWGGRFEKNTDKAMDDFNSSIRFDARLYKQDILGSIAHARMLGDQGIISKEDSLSIIEGLKAILSDIEEGKVEFSIDAEDIHMNIEMLLTERIGDAGKRLHTGRSRNDQVALDLKMYLKDEIYEISELIIALENAILKIARENLDTVMPGYTHLQKAQPITLAHHAMAYANMFMRDLTRLSDCKARGDVMPLGSGALAGTTYPLDRDAVAKELGFAAITQNSLDGVSDRDFAIELSGVISIIMMHLSRYSEELILWSSNEFGFVTMDDSYSTGSSIMPQKKNPDVAELVRGKTGRVYGDLMALLTVMKGIPLAYNKDMQEDKEAIFDAIDTVKLCLDIFKKMLETAIFNKDKMRLGASGGFTNATDAADYLVKKGVPFRDAHAIVGRLVLAAEKKNCAIDELEMDELKACCDMIDSDIFDAISLETCVKQRNFTGCPSPDSVRKSIDYIDGFIKNFKI